MSNIRVELQLADGSFTSGMLRAGQSLNEFNQQLIRTNPRLAALANQSGSIVAGISRAEVATKGFLGTLRDVSIVTGLVSMGISGMSRVANGFVGEIVKVNAEMERLRFMMQAMSTAKDPLADANRSVAYLREQAKNMPFAMGTITNAFVKLKTTGMDPMNGSLRALADGISAFGGDDQAFNRVVMGITQMSGKSVIQMEEMRQQLGESMPAAMQIMARSMGVSIAELTKAISTGRVEAKPALEGFFEELERSYGGEAQRMMQTFSGQVSQLATNLQNLATNEGGRGFFDQVKEQLVDINGFLQSDTAQIFATKLGQGLSSAIGWLRSAIATIFEFRQEILNVGTAVAISFGGLALIRGVSTFVGAIGTLRAAFVGIGVQAQAAAVAQNYYNIVTNSGAPALVRLRAAMLATTATAGVLTTTLAAVAPWVTAIGLAVYAAGNYFGWFTDKVKDNYENLQKYGAETRKQAAEIINARKKQLEAEAEYFKRMAAFEQEAYGVVSPDIEKGLKDTREKIKALADASADIMNASGEREDQEAMTRLDRRLQSEIGRVQNRYREEQVEAERHFDAMAKKDAEEGRVAVKTEEERKAKILEIRRSRSQAIMAILKKEEDEIKRQSRDALGDDLTRARAMLDNVRARWLQEKSILDSLETPKGVQFTNKPIDDDAKITKGENDLKKLIEDITKAQATLGGASGAAAEMWQKIQSGEYGQIEGATAETKKLHEQLMAATAEKEALDNLLKGEKKAEQDLATLKQNVLNKEFELRKKLRGEGDMTESEEFLLKLNEGFYPGLGPIENIREAVNAVTSALDLQGTTLNEIGNVTRNNTFGDQTAQRIQTVNDKLRDMSDILGLISRGLTGMDFSQLGAGLPNIGNVFSGMEMPGWMKSFTAAAGKVYGGANLMSKNPSQWGDPRAAGWQENNIETIQVSNGLKVQVHKAAASAFQGFVNELIGQGYDVKSLGGFNIRNKRGGNSLSEHAYGNAIDINPGKNPMGKNLVTDMPANISALAAKYGLSWGGDWKSVKDAMHFEWRGNVGGSDKKAPVGMPSVPEIPTYNSEATQQRQLQLTNDRIAATERLRTAGQELAQREAAADEGLSEVKRKEALDTITAKTKELATQTDKLGRTEERYVNAITKGELGKSRDPKSAEYQKILEAAREQDRIEKQIGDKTKAGNEATRERTRLEEERAKLVREIAEQEKLAANPDYKPESSAMQNLRKQLDSYVDAVRDAEGENSAAYKAAVDYRSQYLSLGLQRDAITNRAATNAQTRDITTGLLSATQQRAVMMQRELTELDRRMQEELQIVGQSEAAKLQIVEDYEAAKAAVRAKYAQEASPMQKQMTEWRDIQGQLAQASTRWMDSLAGGISDLIMGTGDLRSVIQGIMKDVVNMGVKWLMGSMMQGKGGSGGKKGALKPAAAGKGGSKGAKGGGKLPLFHTGGIVGGSAAGHKFASSAAFMNAPKFHTGGIIGGPKLLPSEVPIIAQKGEGVFTPEQMANMGGFNQQQFNVSSNITVNGSAGTPDQNTDLAKKMAREYEVSVRSVVADELRKQTKAGNFMNTRSR